MKLLLTVVPQIKKSIFEKLHDNEIEFVYNSHTGSFQFHTKKLNFFSHLTNNLEVLVKDELILIHKDNVIAFGINDENNPS